MNPEPGMGPPQPVLRGLEGYTDLEIIAHGGSAVVYRGIQQRLGRQVAVKVLTMDETTTSQQFERELDLTVRLSSHPHIVSIIDTGHTGYGSPYIVMEYCPGGSYAEIVRKQGPRSVNEVIDIGVKIGEALEAAHAVGIVHRDVKPPNILRSAYGPALTDFGIARAAGDLSNTYTSEKLTPYHASPEALDQRPQSIQSDLYSLASTLWHLLAGRAPFIDPNEPIQDPVEFRLRVLNDPVPDLPRDDVPDWLVGELRRAMAKNPAERHASAREFADALRGGSTRSAAWTIPPQSGAGGPGAGSGAPMFPPDFPAEPQPAGASTGAAPNAGWATGQSFGPPAAPTGAPDMFAPPVPTPEPGGAPPGAPAPYPGVPQGGPPAKKSSLLKPLLIAGVIGVVLGLIVIAVTVVVQVSNYRPDPVTLVEQQKPTEVKLTITGTNATISWKDHTDGKSGHLVALYRKGGQPTTDDFRSVPAGQQSFTMNGVDPTIPRCVTVAAIVDAQHVSAAEPVCQDG